MMPFLKFLPYFLLTREKNTLLFLILFLSKVNCECVYWHYLFNVHVEAREKNSEHM